MSARDFHDDINETIEGHSEEEPDLNIDVSSNDLQVDPKVWRDCESLLYRGFIAVKGDINGVPFIFKSLNHHEFEHIQWIAGNAQQDRFYNIFLAYGVFMVEGENVLANRSEWVNQLDEEFFSVLPLPAKNKMVRYLSEINRRASNAVTLTEAYATERSSRFKWAQLQGIDLMSPTCTGVAGTETLGLNFAQLVWRALNHFEDLRDVAEREWDNAKFVGSCSAGKEIQKIYNQDKSRRQKEKEAKDLRKDQLLRQVLLGETPEDAESGKREVKIIARSVEELAKQLEASLRGEKDWHDLVVEAEERRMQEQIEDRRNKINDMFQKRVEEEGAREVSAQTLITQGLTPAQVQQEIQRRRALEAQKLASRMVPSEDPRLAAIMNKYDKTSSETYQKPQAGPLSKTDKDPSTALPVGGPSRPTPNPFRR